MQGWKKGWIGLLAALILLAACQPYQFRGTVLTEPKAIRDFRLDRADGGTFQLSADPAVTYILFFGYTHCPDVCPATMAQVKLAVEKMGDKADSVRVIFVTVDPERDTPEALSGFLGNFNPAFIGLYTPDAATLQGIVGDFGVYYEAESHNSLEEAYLVEHTSALLVVRDSKLLAVLPDDATHDEIAGDVEHLLK